MIEPKLPTTEKPTLRSRDRLCETNAPAPGTKPSKPSARPPALPPSAADVPLPVDNALFSHMSCPPARTCVPSRRVIPAGLVNAVEASWARAA